MAQARRSILKFRQHLLNEAEHLLADLPEALGDTLPDTPDVRPRLKGLVRRADQAWDPATTLRLRLLDGHCDPRRFTGTGGFARFNGTAPLPASSAEGDGVPVRHRLNRGGNRRVNACLHLMAVTQLRCEPRARKILDDARARGHTKKEAMRILKRHLSDVVYRRMTRDLEARLEPPESTSQGAA